MPLSFAILSKHYLRVVLTLEVIKRWWRLPFLMPLLVYTVHSALDLPENLRIIANINIIFIFILIYCLLVLSRIFHSLPNPYYSVIETFWLRLNLCVSANQLLSTFFFILLQCFQYEFWSPFVILPYCTQWTSL